MIEGRPSWDHSVVIYGSGIFSTWIASEKVESDRWAARPFACSCSASCWPLHLKRESRSMFRLTEHWLQWWPPRGRRKTSKEQKAGLRFARARAVCCSARISRQKMESTELASYAVSGLRTPGSSCSSLHFREDTAPSNTRSISIAAGRTPYKCWIQSSVMTPRSAETISQVLRAISSWWAATRWSLRPRTREALGGFPRSSARFPVDRSPRVIG